MSKVAIDAATRDFIVKPRLEYRTLQGVNGPLVILEVRLPRSSLLGIRAGAACALLIAVHLEVVALVATQLPPLRPLPLSNMSPWLLATAERLQAPVS